MHSLVCLCVLRLLNHQLLSTFVLYLGVTDGHHLSCHQDIFGCHPVFKEMADSFYKLEDEAFPSFLSKSLDSTSGRATLGNMSLGSGPGLPVAASTVAKIKPGCDNRWEHPTYWDSCTWCKNTLMHHPLNHHMDYLISVRASLFIFYLLLKIASTGM